MPESKRWWGDILEGFSGEVICKRNSSGQRIVQRCEQARAKSREHVGALSLSVVPSASGRSVALGRRKQPGPASWGPRPASRD